MSNTSYALTVPRLVGAPSASSDENYPHLFGRDRKGRDQRLSRQTIPDYRPSCSASPALMPIASKV